MQNGGCGRILKPQTLQPPTSTFFFMLRTLLVEAASSTVSNSDFSCICQRDSYHDLGEALFSHSTICGLVALHTCTVTLTMLCLA